MGEAFGEAFRREIHELYGLRLENALAQARRYGNPSATERELLALARTSLEICEPFDPDGHAELVGIARGAELSPDAILAMNGLTDLRDALAWGGRDEEFGGCTSVLVQTDRSEDRALRLGQTWDLGTSNQPFVVAVHRKPKEGPETWSVTTVGCLSLMGMSETGVSIATSNLRTRDARPGVPYLSLIHRALRCHRAEEAVELIRGATRAGAHAFVIADADDFGVVLECTATRSEARWLRSGFDVQTNHCQSADHAELEVDTPRASSEARLARMQSLLGRSALLDGETLVALFGDREGGALAINRDDIDGISTNAAFVATPSRFELTACRGAPDKAEWHRFGPGRPSRSGPSTPEDAGGV